MSEKHVIKIAVELKTAKLLVRFPCKLTFQLKTGTHTATQIRPTLRQGRPTSSRKVSASSTRSSRQRRKSSTTRSTGSTKTRRYL